jgi:hypothetical protein
MQRAVIAQIAAVRIPSNDLHQRRPTQLSAISQVWLLAIHISGVSITKRGSSLRPSVTYNAFKVSSRQSEEPE